ncbi:MAG: bifunctional hydroxymethylpyrimidine kinase/phosphomethylpyrimidine kinase [Sulfolobales archaeon]|nr:bifunctional hydroxymethylpyrimidine kinase/phosphomethylpyrimidine kinase [Sulfolobales archaeon]MCX8208733.1 bifunctional hydroxymethylpyrimidine kinase/phosphomethylpyrimidine kinase [Sulfolobales archaeon]MDW8010695.1 bifunctional hydroxymethylpyrimidine kinase/phosphomethylpyrimidine kinase [Sulfolobales archaeon]
MRWELPVAMTIAGVDSGGGAGVAADLKTFAALGVHGTLAVTALTAQNTYSVIGIHEVPPDFVELQIRAVWEDMGVDAAKTGMLSSSPIIRAVVKSVKSYGFPLVVDPVMVAKSGAKLLADEAIETLKKELIPVAKVVTPNRFEAEILSGVRIENLEDAEVAARTIARDLGIEAVVVKGGHIDSGSRAVDVVYVGGVVRRVETERVDGCTHGTGCSFSAAIAAYLAKGLPTLDSIVEAKNFIHTAISRSYKVGRGSCPVNPAAYLELDAELYRAQRALAEVLERITSEPLSRKLADLVPEVQSNIVYSVPKYLARGVSDVVGVPGRIVRYLGRVKVFSYPQPGASSHVARLVLEAMKYDPAIRSAMNLRYREDLLKAARELGMSVAVVDRREEPEEVKRVEGASLPWIVRKAVEQLGKVPDILADTGDIGKEPMVRVFGGGPSEVVDKVVRLLYKLGNT